MTGKAAAVAKNTQVVGRPKPMTDSELRTQIASMRTSLSHILDEIKESKEDRRRSEEKMTDFNSRLTRLEVNGANVSNLPDQVRQNELASVASRAREDAQAELSGTIRRTLLVGFAIAGTISSIIGLGLRYFIV